MKSTTFDLARIVAAGTQYPPLTYTKTSHQGTHMNIPLDSIKSIITDEVLAELLSDLGAIAKKAAEHERPGKISLDISCKIKAGALIIAAVVKSRKPISQRRDEAEKSDTVELARISLGEDEGQQRIEGA